MFNLCYIQYLYQLCVFLYLNVFVSHEATITLPAVSPCSTGLLCQRQLALQGGHVKPQKRSSEVGTSQVQHCMAQAVHMYIWLDGGF